MLLNLKQLGEMNPRMVIGVFEHHLNYDLSGYPRLFRKKELRLFGRILQIADAYDELTTPRVYRRVPYTPGQALAIMLRRRGVDYDPILLKIFMGVVGIFPIGSLLLLDTGDLAIVYKANPEPRLMDRPRVFLVSKDRRGEVKERLVDLAATNEAGLFTRNIVKTLDPIQYHIDIAKYFL